MDESQKEQKRRQIETIFNLVEQFKDSYYEEKKDKKISEEEDSVPRSSGSSLAHAIITSEFKPLEKSVNVLINLNKEEVSASNQSAKWESIEKDKSSASKALSEGDAHLKMLEL